MSFLLVKVPEVAVSCRYKLHDVLVFEVVNWILQIVERMMEARIVEKPGWILVGMESWTFDSQNVVLILIPYGEGG